MSRSQTTAIHESAPIRPLWLRAEGWERFPGLVHGFSRRLSGTLEDYARLTSLTTPGLSLHTTKQVHGNTIIPIQDLDTEQSQREADGMLTSTAGVLLGIKTADCVPVLLVAPAQGVVGALHAGWRGTQKAICLRAVEMCAQEWDVDPTQLWVTLGPSIGGCCYEVGQEIGESLFQRWGDGQPTTWHQQGKKGFLDLRAINRTQFIQAGVPSAQIQEIGLCTFCHPDEFASYRREGAQAGRQLSIIGWQSN